MGKAMRKYSIPREKLVILTKCFFTVTDDPLAERIMPDQANNRDYIMKKGTSHGLNSNHAMQKEWVDGRIE